MARKQKEVVLYDTKWLYDDEEWDGDFDYNWEDFKDNLKFCCNQHKYECGLIAICSAGTWRGRFTGYSKEININDDLYDCVMKLVSNSDYDYVKIYINKYGDLEIAMTHHDGTNYAVIRQLKERYHDENYFEKIQNDLYNGDESSAYKYTKSVKYILKIGFGV